MNKPPEMEVCLVCFLHFDPVDGVRIKWRYGDVLTCGWSCANRLAEYMAPSYIPSFNPYSNTGVEIPKNTQSSGTSAKNSYGRRDEKC